ncbi:MAG TPA: alpha/beta hydrolase [Jatrophihabitantaceae bacterium]|nr:alpha/beta hydrolase [Jatrophihabitantaceae bacterium]
MVRSWSESFVDIGGGITLHVLEQGSGPAVVLCHGFPGLGYSWRHQLPALAAAGYRVITPDLRGYGRSSAPPDPSDYDRAHTVADLVGLLDALGIEQAVFAGHDFGAALTWDLPQWAPGRVRALIQLSVPRPAQSPVLPSRAFAAQAEKHFLHLHYFQQPGVADAELDRDPARSIAAIYWALSGGYEYVKIFSHSSERAGYLDVLPSPPPLPWSWLSADELAHYAAEYAHAGFTGGLNWYRASDAVWHEKRARPDEPVTVPTLFVTGDRDPVRAVMGASGRRPMIDTVPGLVGEHVIEGAGHFVQMEAAEEVNRLMIDFLDSLPP